MTPLSPAEPGAASAVPAWRRYLVLLVGVILLASSGAHGFLGWKFVHQALLDAGTPVDLVDTLRFGWHLGSVAMAAFGVIVLITWSGMRGTPWSIPPGMVIALAYLVFGVCATIASRSLHFVFLFITPGLLLLAGLWPRR